MKTMFRTTDYSIQIKEIEIEKETKNFVYYKNEDGKLIKKSIEGLSYKWHNTEQEAIDYLMDQLATKVESLESRLASAKHDLNEFENTHQ